MIDIVPKAHPVTESARVKLLFKRAGSVTASLRLGNFSCTSEHKSIVGTFSVCFRGVQASETRSRWFYR